MLNGPAVDVKPLDSKLEEIDYTPVEIKVDIPALDWIKTASEYRIPLNTISGIDIALQDFADLFVPSNKEQSPEGEKHALPAGAHDFFLAEAYDAIADALNSADSCVQEECKLSNAFRSKAEGISYAMHYEPDPADANIARNLTRFLLKLANELEQKEPERGMENTVIHPDTRSKQEDIQPLRAA